MTRAFSIVALALIAIVAVALVAGRVPQPTTDLQPPNSGAGASTDAPATTGGRTSGGAPSGIPEDARAATVTSITDGDTLRADVDGTNEPVRLLELDTPEITGDCGATEATQALRGLAPVGSRLWMEADVEGRDRFGRLLRYLYRDDGVMINEVLVRDGWARARLYPPNDRYWPLMEQAQREAQDRDANLWARCDWIAEADTTDPARVSGTVEPDTTAATRPADTAEAVRPARATVEPDATGCDPNYSGCVPATSLLSTTLRGSRR